MMTSMITTTASSYPSAGVFRRLAALIYDAFLLMAISMGYYAVAVLINVLIQGPPAPEEKVDWGHWSFIVFVGWVLLLSYFYCYFWQKSGQTLGMRAWRLKLVSATAQEKDTGDKNQNSPQQNNRINSQQCVLRCMVAPLSLLVFGLGFFWRWFDPQQQTLHDRISKTQVVVLPKDKN